MNKSDTMKRAWQIIKSGTLDRAMRNNLKAKLSAALKMAWNEYKLKKEKKATEIPSICPKCGKSLKTELQRDARRFNNYTGESIIHTINFVYCDCGFEQVT